MPIAPSLAVRLVLDTNIALSGLLWEGSPARLIEAAKSGHVELASTTSLLAELQGVLKRDKFAKQFSRRGLRIDDIFNGYAALVLIVRPAVITPPPSLTTRRTTRCLPLH